jgi:hypothetical protein
MTLLAKYIYKSLHLARDQKGIVILQAIAVVFISAVITSTLVTMVLMEASNQQQNVIRATSSDLADAGMGWASAWAVHADIPIKNATANSMTWTAPDATNVAQKDCYQLRLDTTNKKLVSKVAPFGGGASDCSTELSGASDQVITTGVTNGTLSQDLFTYYSDTSANLTSRIADPTATTLGLCSGGLADGRCAKSFSVNLKIQPTSAAATPYSASYHVIYGGAVTDNLLAANAVTNSAIQDASIASAKLQNSSLLPSNFSSGALKTFNRLTIVANSQVNYGTSSGSQVGVWRSSASSRTATVGGATLQGGPSTVAVLPVDYRDYCVNGKTLQARAIFTVYNPADASGTFNIGTRLQEYTGPNINLTPTNGNAAYTVLPTSVVDGTTAQLNSSWVNIDDGSCSAGNAYLSSNNPFYYTIESKASANAPYSITNAAIELQYASVAGAPGSQAPDTPLLLSPSDESFVGGTPTLSARFTDGNSSDTGTLSFRLCQDSVCGTIISQGSSASGLPVGSTGSWTLPVALSDGSTYYWQARATDSTTLQSSWSGSQAVRVATSPATFSVSSIAPQTSPTYQYATGSTLYFNPSLSPTGSFNLNVVGDGGGFGIDYMEFPTLGSNWTGGSGVVSGPSNGATVTRNYTWSAGASSASPVTAIMVTNAGLEKKQEFDVIADTTAPTGGNLSYPNTYISVLTADLTITRAFEDGSGMPDGGKIEKRSGTFSNGACNAPGSWNPLTTIASGSGNVTYTDNALTAGNCYEYRYLATDRVLNQQIVAPASVLKVGIPPSVSVTPTLSGSFQDLQTVSVGNGAWNGSTTIGYTYQWQRCTSTAPATCSNQPGETSSSYNVSQSDIGNYLRAQVTATNNFGQSSTFTAISPQVTNAPPVNTSSPTVSGSTTVGSGLTVNNGSWTGTPTLTFTYQWQRCTSAAPASCSTITGTNVPTYEVQAADSARYIRAIVTATGPGGTTAGFSALVGPVS